MKKIIVTSGTAAGPTALAAFDSSLQKAGLGDANLIYLSSVIPLGYTVITEPFNLNNQYQGDRVYIVCADKRVTEPGKTAVAGIGWVQTEAEVSWGLFVEHSGSSVGEVKEKIDLSLGAMMKNRPHYQWGKIQHKIVSIECISDPVDAFVAAVYKREEW